MTLKLLGRILSWLFLVFLIWMAYLVITDQTLSCVKIDEKYGYEISSCDDDYGY